MKDIRCKILVNTLSCHPKNLQTNEMSVPKIMQTLNVNITSVTTINQAFIQNCKKAEYEKALIISCMPEADLDHKSPIYSAIQAYQSSLQTNLQKHYSDGKKDLKIKYVNEYPKSQKKDAELID